MTDRPLLLATANVGKLRELRELLGDLTVLGLHDVGIDDLPETADTFEPDARRLVQLIRSRDPRLGIPPSPKKSRAPKRVRFGDKL